MADWKLLIEDDAGQTITVPLFRDVITIGRKEGNTIRLTERNVSRFHAKIIRDNGAVLVEDLTSYNGIKLNGDRIKGKVAVQQGDLIEIGDYHLELQREGAEANSPLTEPTQRLTPSPSARNEPASTGEEEHESYDDEFAGDTQRWEPPASMERVGVGMPTVQDSAPIVGSEPGGEMPTVDETVPVAPTDMPLGVDPDETMRMSTEHGNPFPPPQMTDPFADADDADETMPVPGGPEDVGLLAQMTAPHTAPAAVSGLSSAEGKPFRDPMSGSGPAEAAMPAPSREQTAVPSPPPSVAVPSPSASPSTAPLTPPPRPALATNAPSMRSLAVETSAPMAAHSDSDETQAVLRAPSGDDDAHLELARLVAINTVFAGSVFPITRNEMVVGRVEENDLVIEHRSVSRSHAKVVKEGNRYRILDLKSANGILVNGNEVDAHILRPGDVIELGRVRLRFVPPGERFKLTAAEIERARVADVQGDDFADDAGTAVLGATPMPKSGGMALPGGISKSSAIIAVLGAAVFLLVVALVVLLTRGNGGDGTRAAVDGEATIESATALEKEGDLRGAESMLQALVANGTPDAAVSLARVERGIANQSRVNEMKSLIAEKKFRDAIEVSEQIAEDAAFIDEAAAQVLEAKRLGADDAFTKAEALVKSEDFFVAKAALEDLEFFEPGSARGAALEKAISKSTGEPPPLRPTPDPVPVKKPRGESDRKENRTAPKPRDDKKTGTGRDTEGAEAAFSAGGKALIGAHHKEAAAQFELAISKDPGHADAYRMLGLSLMKLGNNKGAVSNLKTYLQMRPAAQNRRELEKTIAELEQQ